MKRRLGRDLQKCLLEFGKWIKRHRLKRTCKRQNREEKET